MDEPPERAAGPAPGVPVADDPPAGLAQWRARRQAAQAEETAVGAIPAVDESQDEQDEGGPPTQGFRPAFAATAGQAEFGQYPAEEVDSDYRDGLDDRRAGEAYADEYDDVDAGEYADEEFDEPSPVRQWLIMAGQLALGVIGGAAVWLGFNWLWGKIPAAALVAAVAVIGALVWIVRKIRHADDLQTTVLTVLVGLVVTVSPAALLLLSR